MATISLSRYLWSRIREVGIESVMGLPGDFNLNWLDAIYDVPGLKWVGNANELNAAYAADGYARIKGIPGCLVTTHGVGELSAMNGVAGAASEFIPMIHIVGQTPKATQEGHLMIHHSIGTKPDHQLYNKMSAPMRCDAAELWDPAKAPAEIDRVIRECFIQRLPVYIFFPIDLTDAQVLASRLDTKIDLSLPVDKANEEAALKEVIAAIYASKAPSVFVDHLVHTFGQAEAKALAGKLRFPTYCSHMGKGIIDENEDYYIGIYNGRITEPGTEKIEQSDLFICPGWWQTDSNSSFFSRNMPVEKRIDIQNNYVSVFGKQYSNVYMAPFLTALAAALDQTALPKVTLSKVPRAGVPAGESSEALSQRYLWTALSGVLREGDVVLADTGTAAFGVPDAVFPRNTKYICQTYYGSIGYATPAALGCDLALAELHAADPSQARRRTVLITGDGSLQLTMQEIGTMIARNTHVLVVIVNNAGYTIERAIHGAAETYNNIVPYQHKHMLALFGAAEPEKQYRACRTRGEFDAAFAEKAVREPSRVEIVEVFTRPLDIPWRLAKVLELRPGMKEYFVRHEFEGTEPAPAVTVNGHGH